MKTRTLAATAALTVSIAGCAAIATDATDTHADYRAQAIALMKSSFHDKDQATMDRLDQDGVQRLCDQQPDNAASAQERAALEKAELATVKFPADGKFFGNFAEGEKIAQTGVGLQWSDKAGSVAGGNCYACHQLTKAEVSYGNLGPSLYNYGKLRGDSDAIVRYTWTRLYNAKAYDACSNMPRFGHKGILTEQQLKDVMALLLDPKSPVNQ
ncbi:MAG: sulfur oxidation c-type cytochrome SoxX [Herminiimonas sp.]|nr:sulfur oxidation c-type cytochrome SoxX [Herminiimonas sp.]